MTNLICSLVLKYSYWILGHEAAGVVVKIGSGVKDLPVGSKIAIENHFYCENCYTCEVTINIIQMNKDLFDNIKNRFSSLSLYKFHANVIGKSGRYLFPNGSIWSRQRNNTRRFFRIFHRKGKILLQAQIWHNTKRSMPFGTNG